MGLIVDVARPVVGPDCTGGGLSSKYGELTVVNIDGPFEPTSERPAVALIDGHGPGDKIIVRVLDCADPPVCKHCSEEVKAVGRPLVWVHVEGNATSCAQNQLNCGREAIASAGDHVAEPDGDVEPEWQMVAPEGHVGPMFGGNYACSSDGRWARAVGFYGAVPIHDRYETTAEYATYD